MQLEAFALQPGQTQQLCQGAGLGGSVQCENLAAHGVGRLQLQLDIAVAHLLQTACQGRAQQRAGAVVNHQRQLGQSGGGVGGCLALPFLRACPALRLLQLLLTLGFAALGFQGRVGPYAAQGGAVHRQVEAVRNRGGGQRGKSQVQLREVRQQCGQALGAEVGFDVLPES